MKVKRPLPGDVTPIAKAELTGSMVLRREDIKPVFCVNCTHNTTIAHSQHFCGATVSLVTGEKLSTECYLARRQGEPCGPEGRLWQAKPAYEQANA